jgi:hypothetical protein
MNTAAKSKFALMSAALALGVAAAGISVADQHEHFDRDRGGHVVFDERYHHGHYYPRHGEVVGVLPGGYRTFYHGGRPFFFVDGVWYAPGPAGFIVTVPPVGLMVSVLPPFATTVWLGGRPYYYANDVYYQWDPGVNAYAVVAPPAGADQPGAPPSAPSSQAPGDDFFVYPKNGQSQEQQSQDRYECHAWASSQTGFDPTRPGGGVPPDQSASKRDQYRRAMTACLEARGYSVQ